MYEIAHISIKITLQIILSSPYKIWLKLKFFGWEMPLCETLSFLIMLRKKH